MAKDSLKQTNKKKQIKPKTKSKVGRKTKYDTHVLPNFKLIAAWLRDGAIDEVIYKRLQISKDSFYEYKKRYPEFTDLLKTNKEIVDVDVENALLKRALGYSYIEVKTEEENGKTVKTTTTTKFVVPDTTAQIFWLINRSAGKWQNTQYKEIKIDPESNEMLKSITNQLSKRQTEIATDNDIDSLED